MLIRPLNTSTVFHPIGAVIFTNETYKNTLPLILASGAPILSDYNSYTAYRYGPGKDANKVSQASKPSQAEVDELLAEYHRYVSYWTTAFAPTYTALRYVVSVIKSSHERSRTSL